MIEARKIWDIPHSLAAENEYRRKLAADRMASCGEIHPDLVRYKGHFYCCFGEPGGEAPVFTEATGSLRVIRSRDGVAWESVSLGEVGRRFSITTDGLLMANRYHRVPARSDASALPRSPDELTTTDKETPARQSESYLTTDGVNWSRPYTDNGYNTFRWDVAWHKGYGYCLAYRGRDFAGTLYRTADGKTWEIVAEEVFPPAHRHGYEEATLAFDPRDDSLCAVVRAKPVCAILGTATAPRYDAWTWRHMSVDLDGDGVLRSLNEVLGPQMGGPKLKRLSDGRLMLAGKADASTDTDNLGRNDLYWVDVRNAALTRFAALDGYMHYPGVVEHEGMLWISCGKRGPFEVHLLKVAIPD